MAQGRQFPWQPTTTCKGRSGSKKASSVALLLTTLPQLTRDRIHSSY